MRAVSPGKRVSYKVPPQRVTEFGESTPADLKQIEAELTDVYGPRLPASPRERKAGEWVENRMREWGLGNVHTEDYEFGRSWELKHFGAHQIQPVYAPLIAYPKSWTPGTDGVVRLNRETNPAQSIGQHAVGMLQGKP